MICLRALASLGTEPKIKLQEAFRSPKGTFWIYRYILPITNTMVVTILGNTNTLPEKYRIAQYADPPYQLQPLDSAFSILVVG